MAIFRKKAIRPTFAAHLKGVIGDLSALAARRATLQKHCEILQSLLPVLFPEPTVKASTPAEPDAAQGIPAFRKMRPDVDATALQRRFVSICKLLGEHDPTLHAAELERAVKQKGLAPVALLDETLAGRPDAVHVRAQERGCDPALAATVLRLAALPDLARFTISMNTAGWDHGSCPGCGSWPLLGEFRGLEQQRHLRCGLCGASWPFARLRCPFCNNRDHKSRGYFHVEGEGEKYRAATCDLCEGYVKMVASLDRLSAPEVLVADLATLHLDLAAADRGFAPPV